MGDKGGMEDILECLSLCLSVSLSLHPRREGSGSAAGPLLRWICREGEGIAQVDASSTPHRHRMGPDGARSSMTM